MTDTDDTGRQLTSEPGEWFSILDAAQRLNIRDRSVRRMAAEGRLLRRLRQGKAEVWIPESMPAADAPESTPVTSSDLAMTAVDPATLALALYDRVEELAAERTAPLLATIREQAEEIGRLKAELDAELERQLPSVDVTPDRRPWWRRWLGT